jgi:hypothetical protein
MANDPSLTPAGAVRVFYDEVIKRHPLGIPTGEDKAAFWPLLSVRLARTLDTLQACENDYFEGNRRLLLTPEQASQLKPSIAWMEYGLFSGANELAMPAAVAVTQVASGGGRRFRVHLQFTYRDTYETYGRAPDESNTFEWTGIAVVVFEGGRYAIDDFIPIDTDSGKQLPGLAKLFPECKGPRWAGKQRY